MNQDDFKQFRNVISGMGRMYGNEPDALVLDAYWIALKDWSLEDFKSASAKLMGSSKFMPRPADYNELKKAGRMTAGEAWTQALEYARGNAERPLDPMITRVVGMIGGYNAIRMSPTDQTHWLAKRFEEHYETSLDVTDIREALPQLTNYDSEMKKLLGNLKKDMGLLK